MEGEVEVEGKAERAAAALVAANMVSVCDCLSGLYLV